MEPPSPDGTRLNVGGLGPLLSDAMSPSGLFFLCGLPCEQLHSGVPAVINLVRLYCYRQGVFQLVECFRTEAKAKRLELSREGWVVTHTDVC